MNLLIMPQHHGWWFDVFGWRLMFMSYISISRKAFLKRNTLTVQTFSVWNFLMNKGIMDYLNWINFMDIDASIPRNKKIFFKTIYIILLYFQLQKLKGSFIGQYSKGHILKSCHILHSIQIVRIHNWIMSMLWVQ